MDFVRAVSFPFDDENWLVKVAIGSLAMIIGLFLPFIPLGYQVNVARNIIRGRRDPLPGPNDLGQVITDGLMALIGMVIFMIPLLLFICVTSITGEIMGDFAALCMGVCVSGLALLYAIPAGAMFWMGVIRYCESGNFSEFIQIGALWRDVRDNTTTLISLLLYSLLLGVVFSFAATVAAITCVGVLVVLFVAQVAQGHLVGQAGLMITGR